ncbi:MAG: guanylate kinase [Dehalococcoidales bacterium]|jgi:guanylate kinase
MTPTKRDRLSAVNGGDKPLLIVLSGLSGAGKDTVLDGLRKSGLPLYISVSATTRAPRPGEKEGYDYYFVSKEKFQEMINSGQMLEWAKVYGNYYGRPIAPVRQALKNGRDVIVRIDVQGAVTIKKKVPQAILIFLCTLSLAELEKRLRKRRTESAEELELRLNTAEKEIDQLDMFDYVIVNRENEIDRTVADFLAIIAAEKCRVTRRELNV